MTVLVSATDIGPIIRDARKAKEWSQRHLADRCAVHHTYIALIERGHRSPGLGVVLTVFAELGLSLAVMSR